MRSKKAERRSMKAFQEWEIVLCSNGCGIEIAKGAGLCSTCAPLVEACADERAANAGALDAKETTRRMMLARAVAIVRSSAEPDARRLADFLLAEIS